MASSRLLLGLYFGYPVCCATSFAAGRTALYYAGRDFPLKGTGYVPCPTCAETYTAEELTAKISEARFCPTPFPDGDVPPTL